MYVYYILYTTLNLVLSAEHLGIHLMKPDESLQSYLKDLQSSPNVRLYIVLYSSDDFFITQRCSR